MGAASAARRLLDRRAHGPGGPGAAWDAAERQVVDGLAEWDLMDVFRHLHGYGRDEASWVLRRARSVVGRRFDHVFASAALRPIRCEYLHDLRERGLSDHSPIEAEFDWPSDSSTTRRRRHPSS